MNDGGYFEGYPMHGRFTDLNVWNTSLSERNISDWMHCNTRAVGNVLDWHHVQLNITDLHKGKVRKDEVCLSRGSKEFNEFFAFEPKRGFDDTVQFCKNVGGRMAVAVNSETAALMNQTFLSLCSSGGFYSGYTDRETEGHWVDVNEKKKMTREDWEEGEPNNWGGNQDCAAIGTAVSPHHSDDVECFLEYCPICQVQDFRKSPYFVMRGICKEHPMDRFYILKSSTELLGLIQNRIIYSESENRWEVVDHTGEAVAFTKNRSKDFPVGVRDWVFTEFHCPVDTERSVLCNCTETDGGARRLIMHLDVTQPGYFSCEDGTILRSYKVCNNFRDCQDGTDEKNCNNVYVSEEYSIHNPPTKVKEGNEYYGKMDVTINVDIADIFEICDRNSFFDLFIVTDVIWYDKNVRFEFLRSGLRNEIFLDVEIRKMFWLPSLEFDMIDQVVKSYQEELFVMRERAPKMSGDFDEVDVREVYSGSENSFKLGMISLFY